MLLLDIEVRVSYLSQESNHTPLPPPPSHCRSAHVFVSIHSNRCGQVKSNNMSNTLKSMSQQFSRVWIQVTSPIVNILGDRC